MDEFKQAIQEKGVLLIGDVHGCLQKYDTILRAYKGIPTIQVGDFGFKHHHEWHIKNINPATHKICFGNHDDYTYLHHSHSLGNYSFPAEDMMTVRGAHSIDKGHRIEGKSWWREEELTYMEMDAIIQIYKERKPRIMITHDCPQSVREQVYSIYDKSRTSNGLQIMFELHQPELWIHGHHHIKSEHLINNTKFICLAELETLKL